MMDCRREAGNDERSVLMAPPGPILIAGRSGRVAQDLVAAAERLRVDVRAIGRPQLDVTDAESITRVIAAERPRAIINATAVGFFDQAEREPERAFVLNRDAAARLAAAAAQAGIPFLHLSSDAVFDGEKRAPYVEDDPPAPLSVYGRSKLAGEQAVLEGNPAALVVRTSWVFGPHGVNFLTAMLQQAAAKDVVRVVSDQHGTPTAGSDLAGALFAIATQVAEKGRAIEGGIYHVANGGVATWLALAEAIFAGWARRGFKVPKIEPIRLADWPSPVRRPYDTALDCRKVARVFGIVLPPWQETLERYLDEMAGS
jgi:dTDP-4-dehydrorhamnose reductase